MCPSRSLLTNESKRHGHHCEKRRTSQSLRPTMLPPTVLLMLKTPRPGAVKTRLGSQIGVDAACAAYRALVEHQLRHVPQEWPIQVCYEPADAHEEMCAWLGARHAYSPQAAGDLGHRLADATRRHFEKCRAPVVIIGGDCPYLDQARFAEVELLMASVDVALVPGLDGGYLLIALRRPQPRLFGKISW